MSDDREGMIQTFKYITNINDTAEAIAYLEQSNWNLLVALEAVIPLDDEPPNSHPVSSINSTSTTSVLQSDSKNAAPSSPDPETTVPTSDHESESNGNTDVQSLVFNVSYNEADYIIQLPNKSTVEQLKVEIAELTNVSVGRQILFWPTVLKYEAAQNLETILCDLDLKATTNLFLMAKIDEDSSSEEDDQTDTQSQKSFEITVHQQPNGKIIKLSLSGNSTIIDMKNIVYRITSIPISHQEWEGLPPGCQDNTVLENAGIGIYHDFFLNCATDVIGNSRPLPNNDDTDSESAGEQFFDSFPKVLGVPLLISENIGSEGEGSMQFIENYVEEFGEPHPVFYAGSLEDAVKVACHKPAKDRKLLGLYLYHAESVLANIFCDQVMKTDNIVNTLDEKFILYGWDLTFASNRDMFLSSVTACVSSMASSVVESIPIDCLPAIMILRKSRGTCQMLTVLHGSSDKDEFLTLLNDAVDIYEEEIEVEIRQEIENMERNKIKAEQDSDYQASLEADMAKEIEKQNKQAADAAERKRVAALKAEEAEKRESKKSYYKTLLPNEPNAAEKNTSIIRIRKPNGEYMQRRFYCTNTVLDIVNYVSADGYFIEEYKIILISDWPRAELSADNLNKTLHELNLYPQAAIVVQER